MFLLIDNYDSFTFNLAHYFGELGTEIHIIRNDDLSVQEVQLMKPNGIIISPGPCGPDQAGICLSLIQTMKETTPILGVCLGHQAIAQAFGGNIIRAPYPVHGKMSPIYHQKEGIFADLPSPFSATRYHSLMIDPKTLPSCLTITATTHDQVIMGISHRSFPLFGVQFHPESIVSEYGHHLLANFLRIAS